MILSEMKSSKDAITRGTLSGSKCTKIDVGWGFAPDPTGGAYSAPPDPLTGFKGPTSKGKGEGLGRGGGTNRPPHDKILATPLCYRTESQFRILQNKLCRIRRRILQNKFCETESCKSEFCRQNPAGRILQNDDEEILQDRILQNTFCKTKFCKTNSVENEPKIRISFRILFINLRSKTHCRMNGD